MGRIWVLLLVGLAGCPHRGSGAGGGASSGGFSITYHAATTAQLGKHFDAKPEGHCNYDNGTEARWTMTGAHVASGELPTGITLEDGVIGGVPTKAGSFHATIEFSGVMCAGKAYDKQTVDVGITVK